MENNTNLLSEVIRYMDYLKNKVDEANLAHLYIIDSKNQDIDFLKIALVKRNEEISFLKKETENMQISFCKSVSSFVNKQTVLDEEIAELKEVISKFQAKEAY